MTGEYTAIPLDDHSGVQPLSTFRRCGKAALFVSSAVIVVVGSFTFGLTIGRDQMVNHGSSSTFFPEGVDCSLTPQGDWRTRTDNISSLEERHVPVSYCV